jgi:hypothetical protein
MWGGGKKGMGREGAAALWQGRGPLWRRGAAAVSKGGRFATVGQPPSGAAVGHLLPLALAVGAYPVCHVADQPTASASGGCQVLTATFYGGRSYLCFKRRQDPNRRGKWRFEAISANVESDYSFS